MTDEQSKPPEQVGINALIAMHSRSEDIFAHHYYRSSIGAFRPEAVFPCCQSRSRSIEKADATFFPRTGPGTSLSPV